MIGLRRTNLLNPRSIRACFQSNDASVSTPSAPVIPERIAKFRRTVAPVARELAGVKVPEKSATSA